MFKMIQEPDAVTEIDRIGPKMGWGCQSEAITTQIDDEGIANLATSVVGKKVLVILIEVGAL